MPAPLTITPGAVERIRILLKKREKPAEGIRIGVKTKGCSGLQYSIEYADAKNPFDEEVIADDVKVFIDPKAIMFILGTEMDFVDEQMHSGFVFTNPNEKGKCGCGKSFHV